MPNRIIKESIRTSDTVAEMTDFQFRLWVGLIVSADDYGRGDARSEILKGQIFPLRKKVKEKDIESALKTRIENQKTAFKDYVPAEMDKLNDPVLVVDSNYVFLCLTNNNSKAKEVIGK
jgi:hypothetical protein